MHHKSIVKKLLSLVIAVMLMVPTSVQTVNAENDNGTENGLVTLTEGSIGENILWAVTQDAEGVKTLTISGNGEIPSYNGADAEKLRPWVDYKKTLDKVVIGEGITVIGNGAFKGFSNLADVELPSTLERIDAYAFYAAGLTDLTIPGNVNYVGGLAFYNCASLAVVTIEAGRLESLEGSTFARSEASGMTINIPDTFEKFAPDTIKNDWSVFRNISPLVINYGGTEAQWNALIQASEGNSASFSTNTQCVVNYNEDSDAAPYIWDENTKTLTITASGAEEIAVDYEAVDLGMRPWITVDGVDTKANAERIVIQEGVTVLGKHAFRGYTKVECVVFDEESTLTVLREGVFRQCRALTEIEIPESVTEVGRTVFYDCTSLKTAVLRGSYAMIGDQCFGNTSIETLTIPESVVSLQASASGYGQFRGYSDEALATMTVIYEGSKASWAILMLSEGGVGLEKIGTVICKNGEYSENEVKRWTSGEVLFTLIDGVMILSGEGATANYSSNNAPWLTETINEVYVGNGVTRLGNSLFYGASEVKKVTFEDNSALTQIGKAVFRDCDIETVTIPTTVETIGRAAFYANKNLKEVVIGDKEGNGELEYLVALPFAECLSLERVYLPKSLRAMELEDTSLGNATSDNINTKSSFYNCNSITDVYFGGTATEWATFLNNSDCPYNLLVWSLKVHCLEDGVLYRHGEMGMPDGMKAYLVDGVLSLTLDPEVSGTTTIPGDTPWAGAVESVSTVVIYPGITQVEAGAFDGCINLTDVYFIGTDEAWSSLVEISEIEGNQNLFDAQYHSGTHGTCGQSVDWQLDLESGIMTISGSGDMEGYTSSTTPWLYSRDYIEKVFVNEGVTSVGDYALSRCVNLVEVNLANTVRMLGTNAFQRCLALEEIVLPEGLKVIGAKTFNGAIRLEEITLPESLQIVDMKAFDDTIGLRTVVYHGTETQRSLLIISEQAMGDEALRNAEWVYLSSMADAGQTYGDVVDGAWYEEAVNYLLDYQHLICTGNEIGVGQSLERDVVLDILWRRDGAPAMYASDENPNISLNWAEAIGIIDSDLDAVMTLMELADLLYRLSVYNSDIVSNSVKPSDLIGADTLADEQQLALAWAENKGYLSELKNNKAELDVSAILNREDGYSILAAYLQDSESVADRYQAMVEVIKEAFEAGGDGKMYVITPKLFVSGEQALSKCGDCTLIVFPQGSTMMIDGGSSHCSGHIIELLAEMGITELDYFVLSHPHSDHIGGGLAIANYLATVGGSIDHYYRAPFNKISAEDTFRAKLVELFDTQIHSLILNSEGVLVDEGNVQTGDGEGEIYTMPAIDGVTIQLFNPTKAMLEWLLERNAADADVNDISVLLKFTYGNSTYLTGGDLYISREKTLIQEYSTQLQADVMKTNHHGSYTSNSVEWMEAVSPMIAISDADDNGAEYLRERFTEYGAAWYTAGYDGMVVVEMDGSRDYEVITQHDSYMRKDYTGTIGKLNQTAH